jgi:hypothetical protein
MELMADFNSLLGLVHNYRYFEEKIVLVLVFPSSLPGDTFERCILRIVANEDA